MFVHARLPEHHHRDVQPLTADLGVDFTHPIPALRLKVIGQKPPALPLLHGVTQQRDFIHILRMAGDLQPAGNLIVRTAMHHQLRYQRQIQQRQRPRIAGKQPLCGIKSQLNGPQRAPLHLAAKGAVIGLT